MTAPTDDTIRGYLTILNPGKCGSSWLAHALTIKPYLLFPREFDFVYFLEFAAEDQWNESTAHDREFAAVREDPALSREQKLLRLYAIEKGRHDERCTLIDKAPSNCYGDFAAYRQLYRDTKIVFLYRDPRDVFVSNEFFHQDVIGTQARREDIGDPDYLRGQSVLQNSFSSCRKVLELERLLRAEGFDCLTVRYEDMKEDFAREVWRVLEFADLGLTPETRVTPRDRPASERLGAHVERAVGFKPLFRKGIVGDWRNHLQSDEAKQVIKDDFGGLLVELGYESGDDW